MQHLVQMNTFVTWVYSSSQVLPNSSMGRYGTPEVGSFKSACYQRDCCISLPKGSCSAVDKDRWMKMVIWRRKWVLQGPIFGSVYWLDRNNVSFASYQRIVHEYSRRELRYRSDTLNAFSSIAKLFSSSRFSSNFLYGLPGNTSMSRFCSNNKSLQKIQTSQRIQSSTKHPSRPGLGLPPGAQSTTILRPTSSPCRVVHPWHWW